VLTLLGQMDFFGLACVFWIIGLLATVFWVWMLVDVLMSSLTTQEKILWALVIILTNIIGALIYFFLVRQRRPRASWG
jgi:hypothetical protein